ncbi:hypothetical protein [Actinopolymorpha pittospori]|uniref:Uncharacterized protein n=1 Tax=Actinopolymorpha pittospori TaxID=648752 RepID=A0A927MSS6_9ACTN|nr:hypothetical protein [Actinopolymorpha pittospori]MBE1604183.1 hypothetical protein [Actinopolymorpha pittospori]
MKRKRIAIAAATILVGAGVAGTLVAFTTGDPEPKSCEELLKNPPEGPWTCYGPPPKEYGGDYGWTGDPATSVLVHE